MQPFTRTSSHDLAASSTSHMARGPKPLGRTADQGPRTLAYDSRPFWRDLQVQVLHPTPSELFQLIRAQVPPPSRDAQRDFDRRVQALFVVIKHTDCAPPVAGVAFSCETVVLSHRWASPADPKPGRCGVGIEQGESLGFDHVHTVMHVSK